MSRTSAHALLRAHGISLEEIAAKTGLNRVTIGKALMPDRFDSIRYGDTYRIRRAIDETLIEHGADPARAGIWRELDEAMQARLGDGQPTIQSEAA